MVIAAVIGLMSGCTTGLKQWAHQGFKVGPDYARPAAPVASEWIEADEPRLNTEQINCVWWTVFADSALESLIAEASAANLPLREAGARILESRARLAVARGSLFPQSQEAFGSFARVRRSGAIANPKKNLDFDNWNTGFSTSWELDFWGRFRRNIESSEATVDSAIEQYRNTLVILQAEVATAYVQIRLFQQRIQLAKGNVQLQQKTLALAKLRYNGGKTTKLDVTQARANLAATQALIPRLTGSLRESQNALCVLMPALPLHSRILPSSSRSFPSLDAGTSCHCLVACALLGSS